MPYKVVDCYSSDIVEQINGCSGLMWHWSHADYKAVLFARQLTYSLEMSGIKVFPDSKTVWHFDDKVGQKYLLESLNIPVIPSYVFYDRHAALAWTDQTTFPKVFKLRGGAGSENVRLVRSSGEAKRLVRKSFGKGFKAKNRFAFLKERLWHFARDRSLVAFLNISKGIARLFIPTKEEKQLPVEKNYAYFQEFIPGNNYDIRVIVIGGRAFGIKRMVRGGDFRASGSGNIKYSPDEIPERCVSMSFDFSRLLEAQSVAFDFVFNGDDPLVVEISYTFNRNVYLDCPGYWREDLSWVQGSFAPEEFMIEDFLKDTGIE